LLKSLESFRGKIELKPSRRSIWAYLILYLSYIGKCGLKRYGFSTVLDIRLGIDFLLVLAILVINRVCILQSSFDMGMFKKKPLFHRFFFIQTYFIGEVRPKRKITHR